MIQASQIPREVLGILSALGDAGHTAVVAGGAVRDLLLGREPKDYDIATSALPDDVENLFRHTVPTGKQYGTISVLFGEGVYEVTTFREDSFNSDGRRPDSVTFTKSAGNDAARRDATINGMFWHPKEGVLDFVDGRSGIRDKKIKAIGDPNLRVAEDALRMLRYVRQAAQLNFELDFSTLDVIGLYSHLINNVSAERIRDELTKLLLSDNPGKGLKLLEETGLLEKVLPELQAQVNFDQRNQHHNKDIFEHTIRVVESVAPTFRLRWAALLHDIGKPKSFTLGEDGQGHFYGHHLDGEVISKEIMERLKFSSEDTTAIAKLVREHMSRYDKLRKGPVKKLIVRVGEENIQDLLELMVGDIVGSKPPFNFEELFGLKQEVERILNTEEPLRVTDLDINGRDLISLGMNPGPEMGKLLNDLLEAVIANPELNVREELEMMAKCVIRGLNEPA